VGDWRALIYKRGWWWGKEEPETEREVEDDLELIWVGDYYWISLVKGADVWCA
jgi:hypothetical protein